MEPSSRINLTSRVQTAAGYRGKPFPQTHPDRLATLARLHGLEAASPDRCRVLELGCGDGGNLIPMAVELPESDFVGVDLDGARIAAGASSCSALGLRNIKLEARDITDIADEYGKFDYVIAHGVYCWVPGPVRDRLFEVCASLLNPHGVAFVSINALPGWHFLSYLRDFALLAAERMGAQLQPEELLRQVRALAQLFAQEQPDGVQAQFLKEAFTRLATTSDYLLAFDYLGEISEPVSLGAFTEHAKRHGLSYFADANYFETEWLKLPKRLRGAMGKLADTPLQRERLADFFTARLFRRTLLCRAERSLQAPRAELLTALEVVADPKPLGPLDATATSAASFEMLHGARINVTSPTVKTALQLLGEAWPRSIAFEELRSKTRERLGAAEAAQVDVILPSAVWDLFQAGALELRTLPPACVSQPSERPYASALARQQLAHGNFVTNRHHDFTVLADAFSSTLFQKLDGTRDRKQLATELLPLARDGKLAPIAATTTSAALETEISQRLALWARHALLIDP